MNNTTETAKAAPISCWCGNSDLAPFSPEYVRCPSCETLVTTHMRGPELTRVEDDERDFYGRSYWFDRQEHDLNSSSIVERVRTDLYERCAFWLRLLLKYKLPPARSLELGCGHGGFVALLRWIGFDASGLELSPWVVDFARHTFDIPVLLGRVEDQPIAPGALDLIVLFDVLEHLPDPLVTMRRCTELLKPDGLVLIQVPCFPAEQSYEELAAQDDLFLKMLVPDEHLHLFSQPAMRRFLGELGLEQIAFEPPLASHDMIVVASRLPLPATSPEEVERVLTCTPGARLVRATVDAQEHVARALASLGTHAAAKDHDLIELRRWMAHKEQATNEYVASLRTRLDQKETELVVLGMHLAQKEIVFKAQTASLEQQLAEKTQSCEIMRAYAAEKEQALSELLEKRSSLRAMLGEWLAQRFAIGYKPVRRRITRLKRRARATRLVEWLEWLLLLRYKPKRYLLARLKQRTREKLGR